MKTNVLYYGDNLDILRKYVAPESVDLVYLDPPFNSNRDYNVIFKDESNMLRVEDERAAREERLSGTVRVTHAYRREDREWKIVHRHGDLAPVDESPPAVGETR